MTSHLHTYTYLYLERNTLRTNVHEYMYVGIIQVAEIKIATYICHTNLS